MSDYNPTTRELDWDDEIKNDSSPFQVLPEGDYRFTVIRFERARHAGSAKIPACKKAVLTLAVSGPEGSGEVQTSFFLHETVEWKLCQFFVSIGQRKIGETKRMNWGAVPGSGGVCHVGVRKWTGNDGKERESNEITEFYDPENAPQVAAPQQKTWTEVPQGGPTPWSKGSF